MLCWQYGVAEEFSKKMQRYPADISTAYTGNWGNEWVHLVLTYLIQVPALPNFSGKSACLCLAAKRGSVLMAVNYDISWQTVALLSLSCAVLVDSYAAARAHDSIFTATPFTSLCE